MFEQCRHNTLGQMSRQCFCGQAIVHGVPQGHDKDPQDSPQTHFVNQT